jgi:hypothetical protein
MRLIGSALLCMWRSLGEQVLKLAAPKSHPLRRILFESHFTDGGKTVAVHHRPGFAGRLALTILP